MKKLLFIALVALVAVSCKKEEAAVPDFSYYQDSTTPGKVVFTNLSTNATTYDWSFGDGAGSSEKSPEHVYSQNGTYKVVLNVSGNKEATKYVEVTSHPTVPVYTTGQCVFWTGTSTYGQINIRINGGNVGTITQYMTNGLAPNCGQTGYVTLEYPEGTYNFTAESTDGNWTWSGSFTIVNGECTKKQLT